MNEEDLFERGLVRVRKGREGRTSEVERTRTKADPTMGGER